MTQVEIRSKVCARNSNQMAKMFCDKFLIVFFYYCAGFTVVKFASMSSERYNRGKALTGNTLDSQIFSHDGRSVASVTVLQADFRTTVLHLLCY